VNAIEYVIGSNPQLEDSDGDNLSDAIEVNELGTSPLLVDTDGDGYSDFLEVENGWDPLNPMSPLLQVAVVISSCMMIIVLGVSAFGRSLLRKRSG
jgi:hypothetical protein